MLDTPQITNAEPQLAAIIRLTVPREEIRNVMGPAMQEVMATVAEQGLTPAGPLFSHHLKMDPDIFDFEVGVPIARPISAVGRVQPGGLPATRLARTVYRGGFEGLGEAWGEFDEWIRANGLTPAPDLWECYVAAPESDPDPSTWQTELNRPLTD